MAAAKSLKRLSKMTPEELKELFGLSALPTSHKDLDPQKLPFEDLDQFSYEDLEFADAAEQLWHHLIVMHYHAATYNRHSEWFPIACAQLEKDLRMMGSFCLTKAVLEKNGQSFPNLEHMDIKELYGVTCFYFRKCGKAFDDLYATTGLISMQMHQWEMRWYMLGERLKATQVKIQKILDGKIKIDDIIENVDACKREKPAGEPKGEKPAGPLTIKHGALPIIGTYARQMIRERREEDRMEWAMEQFRKIKERADRLEEKEEARDRREQERAEAKARREKEKAEAKTRREQKKAAGKLGSTGNQTSEKQQSDEKNSSTDIQKKVEETGMTLPELRAALLKKAEQRGEGGQVMQIAGDPPERLLERWERYRQKDAKHRPPAGSSGHKKKKGRRG